MNDWIYEQATGRLLCGDEFIGECYSGFENGCNNSDMESVLDCGPIPKGWWSIGEPHDTQTHGPFVMTLTPQIGTETFGRSGFLIHGDSKEHPGEASHGCIVASRAIRERIAAGSNMLKVT